MDLNQCKHMNREDIIRNVYGKDLGNLIINYSWNGNITIDMVNNIIESFDRNKSFNSKTFLSKMCRKVSTDIDFYLAIRFLFSRPEGFFHIQKFYYTHDEDSPRSGQILRSKIILPPFKPSLGISLYFLNYLFQGCYNTIKDHFSDYTGFNIENLKPKCYAHFFRFDEELWMEFLEKNDFLIQERYDSFYIWNFSHKNILKRNHSLTF